MECDSDAFEEVLRYRLPSPTDDHAVVIPLRN